jgi:hypothetical protein
MLLVWQGRSITRRWQIGDGLIDLDGLEYALQKYWHSISRDWPAVEEVKIIVINLARRGSKSNT